MRCSMACGRRFSTRPTSMSPRSTRASPISSRSSCTSPTPMSSSRRSASRAARSRHGSLLTDIAREFGYARSRIGTGRRAPVGRRRGGPGGVRFGCAPWQGGRAEGLRSDARAARARIRARLGGLRGVHDHRSTENGALLPDCRRQPGRPRARAPQRRARQSDRAGGVRRGRPVPQHLHPRDRLLPAGGHGARRVPPRDHHRRRRYRAHRQVGFPRGVDAVVPAPEDLSGSRALHDRRRGALAAARRLAQDQGTGVSRPEVRRRSGAAGERRRTGAAGATRSAAS